MPTTTPGSDALDWRYISQWSSCLSWITSLGFPCALLYILLKMDMTPVLFGSTSQFQFQLQKIALLYHHTSAAQRPSSGQHTSSCIPARPHHTRRHHQSPQANSRTTSHKAYGLSPSPADWMKKRDGFGMIKDWKLKLLLVGLLLPWPVH